MVISLDEFEKGSVPIMKDKAEPKDAYIRRLMKVPNIIGCHGVHKNPTIQDMRIKTEKVKPIVKGTRIIGTSIYWNKDVSLKGNPKKSDYKRLMRPRIISDEDYKAFFIETHSGAIMDLLSGKDAYRIDEIANHLFGRIYTDLDQQIIKNILITQKAEIIDQDADRYYFMK